MLDLFSGKGGASKAMRARGWDVVTVDNEAAFNPDIIADLTTWSWTGGPIDLLWASPPCQEFARESMPWAKTGKPRTWIVKEIKPRWWILENVKGAQPYLGKARWVRNPVYLWGEFPAIYLGPIKPWKQRLSSRADARRAQMPYELSHAIAQAIEDSLILT
jgi:hypothetical protein